MSCSAGILRASSLGSSWSGEADKDPLEKRVPSIVDHSLLWILLGMCIGILVDKCHYVDWRMMMMSPMHLNLKQAGQSVLECDSSSAILQHCSA